MELNTMQIFWQKRWLFSILVFDLKREKKTQKSFSFGYSTTDCHQVSSVDCGTRLALK
jgi:hypothetical protein